MAGPEFFVSPPPAGVAAEDAPTGSGTLADPFHSIAHAMRQANGGGTVLLRGGQYVESIDLTEISGTEAQPLLVRPRNVERVTIDATVLQFRGPVPNTDWEPVPGHDGEFVSTAQFNPTAKGSTVASAGAFLARKDPQTGRNRHTRLVAYNRLEDLRSPNQLWPSPELNPAGLDMNVFHEELTGAGASFNPKRYRPFVYMGPGIWFEKATGPDGRRVHIRLSPTNNQINEWPDYTGEADPRRLRLALSFDESHVLRLVSCHDIRFQNLTMRFGGSDTIRLRDCARICFDQLTIWSASRAIRLQNKRDNPGELNKDIEFKNCEVDGGLPTWFFRSDRKDEYRFRPVPGGPVVRNLLGHATGGTLISSDAQALRISIHHCEILNGHDIAVAFGDSSVFHHNWVHNINDDGLIMTGAGADNIDLEGNPVEPEDEGTFNARVYLNVISQCLTAMSFAGGQVGQIYIYRNLFDLRARTLGIRPRKEGEQSSLRHSQFFKDGTDEGPFDLFHNTCVILDPGGVGEALEGVLAAGFGHYRTKLDDQQGRRRAFNNIFVVVYSQDDRARAIAFLPPNSFLRTHRRKPLPPVRHRRARQVLGDGQRPPRGPRYLSGNLVPLRDGRSIEEPAFPVLRRVGGHPSRNGRLSPVRTQPRTKLPGDPARRAEDPGQGGVRFGIPLQSATPSPWLLLRNRVLAERRCQGQTAVPAYCAVALAGLDDLPDTIRTRSVIIRMRRRAPSEHVEPWRHRVNGPQAWPIADKLRDWCNESAKLINWPDLPDGIEDRDADVWEALLAIADLAGGEWPARARRAAVTLVTAAAVDDKQSLGIQLLADLRTVFGDADVMATETILERLNALEESPWADLRGRELDARGLANRLRRYEVKPQTVRPDAGHTAKGYRREDLADIWSRYLSPVSRFCRHIRHNVTTALGRGGKRDG